MKMNKKEEEADSVGNKVLSEAADVAISTSGTVGKWEKIKGDKIKTILRMKQLLRMAAAAKAEKGGKYITRKVLQFRNRGVLKSVRDDHEDEFSTESPKISFKWEIGNCSVSSSGYSMASSSSKTNTARIGRNGNWITTDSDFVVLEL